MLFSLLMSLSYAESGIIELDALRQALPSTPEDVLNQFYADHGRNCAFQNQYGHLDINRIEWQLKRVPAEQIISCTVWREFQNWCDSVAERVNGFATKGWNCIDVRSDVRLSWECERTWIRPPILLSGAFAPLPQGYILSKDILGSDCLEGSLRRTYCPVRQSTSSGLEECAALNCALSIHCPLLVSSGLLPTLDRSI